jgi:soluble lytic murein transglycosylase-like protein
MLALAVMLPAMIHAGIARAQTHAAVASPSVYQAAAALYGLDPKLLEAIATVESQRNSTALSAAGAAGLMQLMPGTAEQFRVRDRFDAVDNLLGAARFLRWLGRWGQTRHGFDVYLPDIIAAYNAGPQAVARYKEIPPYPETRRYVRRVLFAYLLGSAQGRAVHRGLALRESVPRGCRENCDQHWMAELQRIRTLRRRANAP